MMQHEMSLREKIMWRYVRPVVGWIMDQSIRYWCGRFMDQFEGWKFKDSYGNTVYISFSYHSEYPDSFADADNPDKPYGDPPDVDKTAHSG